MLESAAQIQLRALRLLTRREHSVYELKQKLLQRGANAVLIDSVLEQLVNDKLLSDDRFARSYLRMRAERGYGPQRIQAELQQRGVSAELIETCLAEEKSTWLTRAAQVKKKKFKEAATEDDFNEIAKQKQFLYRRGFSADDINRVFKNECDDIEDL